MRTKSIEILIDRIFWALVLSMPIFAYLFGTFHADPPTFITILSQFQIDSNNIVYTTLVSIFGTNGAFTLFDISTTNVVFLYMAYFVSLELLHIVVDVILFVPRVSVKLIDKASTIGSI